MLEPMITYRVGSGASRQCAHVDGFLCHPLTCSGLETPKYIYRGARDMTLTDLPVGSHIWFTGEKQCYTVMVRSTNYLICTKPFNPRKTVLYTIVDIAQGIRGTEDLIFCFGAETREACEEMLERIVSGESGISRRNRVSLQVERIVAKDAQK